MTPSQFTRVLTLSFACWSVGASAQSAALKTVEVVATGTASAAADTASFSVGVSAASARATTAVEHANTTLTAIIDALKSQMSKSPNCAVPNALETSGFRVQPRYARKRDQPPQLTGYEVQRTLTVSINNPANCLGLFLDSALNAGATQINSVQRGLSDPQAVQDAARTNAFTQAKRRAEQLAKLAGASLSLIHI